MKYFLRRLGMALITLLGITFLSFFIINLAPGSPVEQKIQQIRFSAGMASGYGVSEEVVETLRKQYGFDKPLLVRYGIWLKNILSFNFGESFSYEEPVTTLLVRKAPVTFQFGILAFLLTYLISIPLGLSQALRKGSFFDRWSRWILIVLFSVPPLILGVLLRVYFAGGYFLDWFPLGGTHSDLYFDLNFFWKILDRIHHFVLPMICYVLSNFVVLTFLMRNSALDELSADYTRTARAKGLEEKQVVYKHVLRNSLIPMVTGLGSFFVMYMSGSVLVEQIFNLDGIGLLSYKAALDRDYNVLMALIFFQSVFALGARLLSDWIYTHVDPRVDFQ